MKPIAILAIALFLASAPSPDSDTITELSAGFLSSSNAQPLMAADAGQTTQQVQAGISASTSLASVAPVAGSPGQIAKQENLAD